jgi:hypothetical protein
MRRENLDRINSINESSVNIIKQSDKISILHGRGRLQKGQLRNSSSPFRFPVTFPISNHSSNFQPISSHSAVTLRLIFSSGLSSHIFSFSSRLLLILLHATLFFTILFLSILYSAIFRYFSKLFYLTMSGPKPSHSFVADARQNRKRDLDEFAADLQATVYIPIS